MVPYQYSICDELAMWEKEIAEEGGFLTSDPRLARMRDLQRQLDELEFQFLDEEILAALSR